MSPSTPAQLLQQGLNARQAGDPALARRCFETVLQLHPGQPDASLLLGDLEHAQGRWAAAVAHLRGALQQRPGVAPAWFKLGDALEELAQWTEAENAYQAALAAKSDLAAAHYALARLQHRARRSEHALAQLALGLACAPPPALRAQMLQLKALLEDEAGELTVALATLQQGLATTPDRAALHHNAGVLLQRLGRPAEALAALDRALALGLGTADAHYNRGNALQGLGRLEDADAAYGQALATDAQHGLALYDRARLRWRLGRPDFTSHLDQAAQADSTSPLALGIKGRLLLRAEAHEAAAEAFMQAVQRAPQVAGYHDGLGQALARLGRHGQALAAHHRAVELAPDEAAPRINLAATLLQAGEFRAAQGAAEAAIQRAPQDQQAWAFLGLAWRANGDAREAWLHDYHAQVQTYDLAPPPGWSDMASFNAALAEALGQAHTDRQAPVDQTLRHGTQTVGNLFDHPQPLVQLLKAQISEAVNQHVHRLGRTPVDANHPLRARHTGQWRFSDSWSSRLQRGGFHTHHVHPHGWISSCYYVALPAVVAARPDPAQPHAGWISFGTPDITLPGCDTGARRQVQPAVGCLVLFPSSMWHGTVPFQDEGPRLTVAFDVLPA